LLFWKSYIVNVIASQTTLPLWKAIINIAYMNGCGFDPTKPYATGEEPLGYRLLTPRLKGSNPSGINEKNHMNLR
jgi:hypothetical protein